MEHSSIDSRARPITWGRPFQSTLVADEPNLSGLIVRFGTFRRTNRSKLKLAITRLRTGERKSIVLSAKDLVDNEFVTPPVRGLPEHRRRSLSGEGE